MPELTEDHVRESLKEVIDPELFINIIDLGLVYAVDIQPTANEELPSGELESGGCKPPDDAESPAGVHRPLADAAPLADAPQPAEPVRVKIDMTMTSPACPAGPQLIANAKSAVSRLPGVCEVEVRLVMEPPWTPDRMTEDARDQLGIF